MNELVKFSYKHCTTHSTQLYKKKNGVHIARTGAHIARTGKEKKGVPNARNGKNFVQSLYDE